MLTIKWWKEHCKSKVTKNISKLYKEKIFRYTQPPQPVGLIILINVINTSMHQHAPSLWSLHNLSEILQSQGDEANWVRSFLLLLDLCKLLSLAGVFLFTFKYNFSFLLSCWFPCLAPSLPLGKAPSNFLLKSLLNPYLPELTLYFQPILGHQQLLALIWSWKLEKQGFPKSCIPLLPLFYGRGFPFSLLPLSLVLSSIWLQFK